MGVKENRLKDGKGSKDPKAAKERELRRDSKSAKEPARSVPSASATAPRSAAAAAAAKLAASKLNGSAKLAGAAKLAPAPSKLAAPKLAAPAKMTAPAKVVPAAIAAKIAPAPTVVAAALLEFKVADKVVYPAHGVGVIDSIEIRKVGGGEQKFYRILFPEAGMKIMVSVSQVANVGLRKVVDHKTVEQVYGILRDRNVAVDTQTWNRRFRDYSQKIKTGSVLEIAKVIRDLSALKSDKELSFGERRMLDTAQGLLVKEISIAKSKSEDVIRAELQSICSVHAM